MNATTALPGLQRRSFAKASPADWGFYVLSAAPGALLAVAAWQGVFGDETTLWLFAVSFVALNVAHLAATWAHLYLAVPSWRSTPKEWVLVPATLFVLALAVDAAGGWVWLLNLQLYFSIHHVQMQNYGILRQAQRRAGRTLGARTLRIDQAACLMIPAAAWMWRARVICDHYRGAQLFAPPPWVIALVAAAGVVALVACALRELIAWRRQLPVDGLALSMLLIVTLIWTGLLLAIPHPLFAIYAIGSAHYVQYLYFVWRSHSEPQAAEKAKWLSHVAPPVRGGYLAALVALGILLVGAGTVATVVFRSAAGASGLTSNTVSALPPWSTAIIAINFAHYWLDSRIWRTGKRAAVSQSIR